MKSFKNIHFHFVGIGGVGMSGLAELVHLLGAKVSGSDVIKSENTQRLEKLGIQITFGHNPHNIKQPNTVVYSSVIKQNNPEILKAHSENIPVISRSDLLAHLMELKRSIAVAGSHGKTSTTSMLASILIKSELDPTVIVGGRLSLIKSTSRLGKGSWLITEADESDGSFIKLSPEIAIVTNIDNDHLDYYGSMQKLEKYMQEFVQKTKLAIVNTNDRQVFQNSKNIVTCGFDSNGDYNIKRSYSKNSAPYIAYKGKKELFELNIPGDFNALNALMAIAVSMEIGVDIDKVHKGINNFNGLDRRFEFKGEHNGILFYDDYGHHPTEIKSIIKALKSEKRLVVAFQPHRFSRTQICWDEFTKCFDLVDKLFLFDVYPASEFPIRGITSKKLTHEILIDDKQYIDNMKDGAKEVADCLRAGDIFLTLGAGDIYELGEMVKDELCTK